MKTPSVDDFLASLDTPVKAEIEAVRHIILAADPAISEGIKWNAPSFFYKDWFATFHLRTRSGVQLILHRGAKAKDGNITDIADPSGLLEWLAKDRATIKFEKIGNIETQSEALRNLVRAWIAIM